MFYVNLDMSGILELLQVPKIIKQQIASAGNSLTAMTKDYMTTEAQHRLKSRRKMFIEGLRAQRA